jgi:hypothetical protein
MKRQTALTAAISAYRAMHSAGLEASKEQILQSMASAERMSEAWDDLFSKAAGHIAREIADNMLLSTIILFKNASESVTEKNFLRKHCVAKRNELKNAVDLLHSFYSKNAGKNSDPVSRLGLIKTCRQPMPEIFLWQAERDVVETYDGWLRYIDAAFPLTQKPVPHITFAINLADTVDCILGPQVKTRIPAVLTRFIAVTTNVVFEMPPDGDFSSENVRKALKDETKRRGRKILAEKISNGPPP